MASSAGAVAGRAFVVDIGRHVVKCTVFRLKRTKREREREREGGEFFSESRCRKQQNELWIVCMYS